MSVTFDFAEEQARFLARKPLLDRHWAQRLELAKGIVFQPETRESVEDQVVETLWADGKTLASIPPEEAAEAWASFKVLSPRREADGWSLVATLLLGFPDTSREEKMAVLSGLPDQLLLELSDGTLITPNVDRGAADARDRLPAVLALRYFIPDGLGIAALVSNHAEAQGRWLAPASWSSWPS